MYRYFGPAKAAGQPLSRTREAQITFERSQNAAQGTRRDSHDKNRSGAPVVPGDFFENSLRRPKESISRRENIRIAREMNDTFFA